VLTAVFCVSLLLRLYLWTTDAVHKNRQAFCSRLDISSRVNQYLITTTITVWRNAVKCIAGVSFEQNNFPVVLYFEIIQKKWKTYHKYCTVPSDDFHLCYMLCSSYLTKKMSCPLQSHVGKSDRCLRGQCGTNALIKCVGKIQRVLIL